MFESAMTRENHPGRVLHQAEHFRVVECAACGFAHVDPKPPPADLERFYEGQFYDEANPDYLAKTEREIAYWNQVVFAARERQLRSFLGAKGRILDIGCCGGFLLRYFAEQGWDVLGLEPGRSAYQWATEKSRVPAIPIFFELAAEEELGRFDAVHLAFVIEHVREPKEFLQKIRRILKPGGVVCLEVPNDFNPLQAVVTSRLSKEAYWICAPDHINYFTFDSMENLLRLSGFDPLRRQATFPLELFLLMGEDYVGNESVGLACHERRMRMESQLCQGGAAELLDDFYGDLAQRGLGREMVLYARKPENGAA
jgi:2-polyprenyl-3-methyl-5-hydroxy-6-metoxy-1,4-benzoquinol methylase